MQKQFQISFAPLSDSLNAQITLQGFKCEDKKLERFEKLRNSINMLYFNNYMTETEKDKKFKKLFDEMKRVIKIDEQYGSFL